VKKEPGHVLYAGSINQSGILEVRADKVGPDTSYRKIIEAVEKVLQRRLVVAFHRIF
jgi:Cd2+/Zn2+-exporting ATPase/Cu+-exporting ATPase